MFPILFARFFFFVIWQFIFIEPAVITCQNLVFFTGWSLSEKLFQLVVCRFQRHRHSSSKERRVQVRSSHVQQHVPCTQMVPLQFFHRPWYTVRIKWIILKNVNTVLLVGLFKESVEKEALEDDKDQRPRIRPTSVPFLIFPSGSTFSLFCKTDALAAHQWNVNWRLPFAFHNDDYDTVQVKNLGQRVVATLAKANGKSSQSDYSVLTITNASHLDTGYYTCHRADNDSISVRQYVFIQGKMISHYAGSIIKRH